MLISSPNPPSTPAPFCNFGLRVAFVYFSPVNLFFFPLLALTVPLVVYGLRCAISGKSAPVVIQQF